MVAPFTRDENQLNRRYNGLGQRLNRELGYRAPALRFRVVDARTGVTLWRLENTDERERQGLAPGMTARLAIAADQGAELQFYFSEHWIRERKIFRFKSSNLKFNVISTDPGALPLSFRLEWSAREVNGSGKYVFPGKGAAHPHWQFDGELRNPITQFADSSLVDDPQLGEIVDVVLGDASEVVNVQLGDDTINSASSNLVGAQAVVGALPWFHKLHLPARALWSASECVPPELSDAQQHQPADADELDRWLVSALRYMKHEFQLYSA